MSTSVSPVTPPPVIAPQAASARLEPNPDQGKTDNADSASGDEQLQKAVDDLNRHFAERRTDLRFSIDKDLNRVVVTVVDTQDGTVLRQIPSEDALRIARAIQNSRAGRASSLIETSA